MGSEAPPTTGRSRHDRTGPTGGTGTVPTAANNMDTDTAGAKNVTDRIRDNVEFPETDANRGSWATNSLASDKFHNLEGQKETDTLAASGGLSDEMMKRKPGGSETPGANALKDAWDSWSNLKK